MTQSIIRFKFIKLIMALTLFLGIMATSCSKNETDPVTPAADKAALQVAVNSATALHDNTVEGTKPGQYEVGFKAALKTALDAAKLVLANPTATQAQVNNAVAQLNAAIAAYQSHLINEIAAANLSGYWKMNGNTNDSSGKGNNGVATAGHAYYGGGTLALTADRFGRANSAYKFDKGANINVPYSNTLNPQQMTISLWCKKSPGTRTINTDTYTMVAMNRWNGYKFQLQGGNLTFLTVKASKGSAVGDTVYHDRDNAGVALTNEVWYHVATTYKSGVMSFYINGDLVKEWTNTPGTAVQLLTPIDFVIGQDLPTSKYQTVDGDFQVAWGGFWTGDLDDVMFYNIALDAPQVRSIYNNQKTL
jgi:hypothetical protein